MALLDLEKLRRDINILFGYVRCLMAKSDEDCTLVATEWSANHLNATGNPYTAGTYVFWNGHVYKCLFDNEGIPPTNTTYWLDLGEGHLLAEEQSDWNATGGRQFILNKPTNTSDFTNDGEDGSSPYATLNDVSAAIPLPQDIFSVLTEGDTAGGLPINVESIGLYDTFALPHDFARIYSYKNRIYFQNKLGVNVGHIRENVFALRNGSYEVSISTPTLTGNITASFQNASGVIAYLSDIPVITIPTLDTVLFNGNLSQINAFVGDIGIYNNHAPSGNGYVSISGNKNVFHFYNNIGTEYAEIYQDTLTLRDSGSPLLGMQIKKPASVTANRVATFQDASGTVAYLSDIPGQYTLVEYADNATAIAAGLPIGRLYRTGDLVKVVH